MKAVLTLLEHDRGEPSPSVPTVLGAGRRLATVLDARLEALVVGSSGEPLSASAARFGASLVHIAHHPLLEDYGPDAWGETLAQAVVATEAAVVVAAATDRGNEVMAHAAARLGTALVANVIEIETSDPWLVTRIRWGGSLLEQAELASDVKMLTVAPGSFDEPEAPVAVAQRPFEPALDEASAVTLVVDRELVGDGATLATAPVVVGGGRGVGSAEGFGILEELAELLGGVVGCSRVATNNGWRPHADQVGQTGTRIAPDLYIACGISGAMQHWVGAAGARTILAVNTDEGANMVARADYAVIGDLHEVIPAVTEEVRRRIRKGS